MYDMAKVFRIQNKQNGTPQFVKRAPKWKFLSLMDHSVILTQILNFYFLYTQMGKIKADT